MKANGEKSDTMMKLNIEGTKYCFYYHPSQDKDQPLKYGMIRLGADFNAAFDFAKDGRLYQYPLLAKFTIKHIQNQIVEVYGLKEVWFPEARFVGKGPKCNIFMSKEFLAPNVEVNKTKTALVLIQSTGAVRAGEWARSVCLKEDLFLGSTLP